MLNVGEYEGGGGKVNWAWASVGKTKFSNRSKSNGGPSSFGVCIQDTNRTIRVDIIVPNNGDAPSIIVRMLITILSAFSIYPLLQGLPLDRYVLTSQSSSRRAGLQMSCQLLLFRDPKLCIRAWRYAQRQARVVLFGACHPSHRIPSRR